MFHTIHKCEWCDRDEPTVCVGTPSIDGAVVHEQYSYLCLWCITGEYNRIFILKE